MYNIADPLTINKLEESIHSCQTCDMFYYR